MSERESDPQSYLHVQQAVEAEYLGNVEGNRDEDDRDDVAAQDFTFPSLHNSCLKIEI